MRNGLAILVIVLFVAINPFSFGETSERSELNVLLELFKENSIELEEWKLYTRGEIEQFDNEESFIKGVSNLMSVMESFDWEETGSNPGDHTLYATGTYLHSTLPIEERLSVFSYPSSKDTFLMYISYELSAMPTGTSQIDLEEVELEWQATIQSLFSEEPQVFTLVRGKENNSNHLHERAENLLKQLSAEKVEQLKETNFVSISAYNEKWDSNLMSNNQKINLQLGLRQEPILGGRTTVTIGTPIITIEY